MPWDDLDSFATFLQSPDLPAQPTPRPLPVVPPATGTGDWFTAGLGAGVYGGLSAGARGLQAIVQGVGASDAAKSIGDWAERQRATEQTFARPDLEEHPWSPTGIAYNIARMVPMGLAAFGGGALATAAAPEAAAAGLAGAAGTM